MNADLTTTSAREKQAHSPDATLDGLMPRPEQ